MPESTKTPQEIEAAKQLKITKFKELGVKRTQNALKAIDLIAGLANKANYTSTPEQHEVIINALRKGVDDLEAAFKGTPKATAGITL